MATERTLMKQGAEAKLYRENFYGRPCIVKERFKKTYRHPTLDASLTAQRMKSEVRAMLRSRMCGIFTPTVYFVDMVNSSIYMEEVQDSQTVRDYIMNIQQEIPDINSAMTVLEPLGKKIGEILGVMHKNNIIHGDLTSSNMLVKGQPSSFNIVMIDFGLSHFENMAEDKGVDLYVLERALLSTHPNTERVFQVILDAYCVTNKDGAKDVLNKLEEVRMRGRKRTMVG
ncbi:TP53-regulating kinase-like [Mizuhopecten yessoensis]|uniref:TP53-regulating kinase-like n=1 Tax=Mizuhopecten yessoensis TaxID=6573 RepID=UPI000B458767|nr:TP53-regulating kinase-like [Mizuhopecten yessoensis]